MSGRLPACAMQEPLPARAYANCAASGDGAKRRMKKKRREKKAATKTPSVVQTGLTVKLRVAVRDKEPFFPERNILISLTYTDLTDWASVNWDVR